MLLSIVHNFKIRHFRKQDCISICEATVENSYPFGVLKKYGVRIFHLFSDNFSVRVAVAFLIASDVIVVSQRFG